MVSVIFAVLVVSFWALTTVVKLRRKFLTLIFSVTNRDVKASRPKFQPRPWPRNLWPWPRHRPRDPLASASSFWSRPRTLIFNIKEPGVLSFRNTSESPSKKRRTALFGHYRAASQNPNASDEPSNQLSRYIILINSDSFDSTAESSALSKLYSDFALLQALFQRLFCVSASSAAVEIVCSQSVDLSCLHTEHTCQMLCSNACFF